jgi:hypothetical protein
MGYSASNTSMITASHQRDKSIESNPPKTAATSGGRSVLGGVDSLNETKMSFSSDLNAAVKFNGNNEVLIPPDTDSERNQSYYNLSTTNRTSAFVMESKDPVAA